jgi:hypothetical protein
MKNTKNYTMGLLSVLLLAACASQDATTLELESSGLGETEQEIGLKPAKKGCYKEPGIFHAADGTLTPFSAYVCWLPPDNNFVVVGSFGALETDLSKPDATLADVDPVTFFPTDPTQPFLYEYAEGVDCSPGLLTTDCIGDELVYFSMFDTGSVPFIQQELVWSLTRAAKAPNAPTWTEADYVFQSVAAAGEGVDAFNYPVTGQECEDAVNRMASFFSGRGVVFSEITLNPATLCD